jgi:hypothetical protein
MDKREDYAKMGRIIAYSTSDLRDMGLPYGFILLGSNYYYFTRVFQKNKNIPALAAFTLVNFWVASTWTKLLAQNVKQEAVIRNNTNEINHLKALGRRLPF